MGMRTVNAGRLVPENGFLLSDVREPNLLREQFPWSRVPPILFDRKTVAPDPPEAIWITDTTFRDGQQARPPYTPKQIAALFDFLHRLGGERGIIRQSEFFLYSKRDREALELCRERGYEFPEITGWIRAAADDFQLVKRMELRETGILTSVSDYHIFLKLKKTRSAILDEYLGLVKTALEHGILPRCHFEDVTRADIQGFCLPFAAELLRLAREAKTPIKIRLCDTMGYGISYPGAILPRSVPKLVHAFRHELGYPPEWLEWHGHNDFHKVHINGGTAWLYGVSALNTSLLGYGERTGNPPLESAVMEYIGLTGDDGGMDTAVITEIGDYFRKELKAEIPSNFPFVGSDFNTTRAGIHADGILKNQEIYNIFDTEAILNRPLKVTVTDKSGAAGIARWLNENIPSIRGRTMEPVSKRHPGIRKILAWVSLQYENGRTTGISPEELTAQARHYIPSLFVSHFEEVRAEAMRQARRIALKVCASRDVLSLRSESMEPFLNTVVHEEGSIQLMAVTDPNGRRISQVYTQRGEKHLFRNLLNKDFRKHDWFLRVLESGEPYFSDLFVSKYTGRLVLTAALPLRNAADEIVAVIDIDFIFDELVKLVSAIPDEILEL